MKFYLAVLGSTMKNWLNVGGDLGILRWVNEHKNTIIVVAYPDRGAGNDPKLFFFWGWGVGGGGVVFHHQGSTIFTVGNMGVMICLGQGVCALWVLLVESWNVCKYLSNSRSNLSIIVIIVSLRLFSVATGAFFRAIASRLMVLYCDIVWSTSPPSLCVQSQPRMYGSALTFHTLKANSLIDQDSRRREETTKHGALTRYNAVVLQLSIWCGVTRNVDMKQQVEG